MNKINQQGVIPLLILISSVGILVFLVFVSTAPIGTGILGRLFTKSATNASEKDLEKGKRSLGYIVEFKDDSLIRAQKKRNENFTAKFLNQSDADIKNNHETAKKDIIRKLGLSPDDNSNIQSRIKASLDGQTATPSSGRVLGDYINSFNGIAIDISPEEAESLKSLPNVKNVYPNLLVKSELRESAPLLQVDKVWPQIDTQGKAVTGKGVNIAVLDTGIDVTHPDLGSSQITERPMTKINTSQITDPWSTTAMDSGQIAYGNGAAISVYSFSDGKSREITLPKSTMRSRLIAINGDLVAYVTIQSTGISESDDGIYLHNKVDNTSTKISGIAGSVVELFVGQGKVIFESNSSVYIYDIATKQTKTVGSAQDSSSRLLKYDNGKLVWGVWSGIPCVGKAVIYSIATEQTVEYPLQNAGIFLDFADNKLLFPDICGYSQSMVQLDTVTGQSITFDVKSSSVLGSSRGGVIGSGVIFINDWFDGRIMAYDIARSKLVQVNAKYVSGKLSAFGKKVCFIDRNDKNLYCHDYDSSSEYPSPNIYNAKVINGYNFILDTPDTRDNNGHGTHVAAIVAGKGLLIGIAPEANLYSYKVLDGQGYGYSSLIISAIERGINTLSDSDSNNDIHIMNLSLGADCQYWGGYDQYCSPDDPLSQAVDNAVDAGITMVVAAGNSGPGAGTIYSPGTSRKAITVGAIDKTKQIASFSSRGPINWLGVIINKPDVVATGVNICAAKSKNGQYISPDSSCIDNNHVLFSGTSMATPHVSGIVALLKQYKPKMVAAEAKDILKTSASSLGLPVDTQGAGLVDAFAAFKKVNPSATVAPTPTPVPTPTPNPNPTTPPVSGGPNFVNKSVPYCTGSVVSRIHLEWDTVPGATLYKLFRSTDAPGSGIKVYENNWYAYNDEMVNPGTKYHYTVEAMIPGGSKYGNTISITAAKCQYFSNQPVPGGANFNNSTLAYCAGSTVPRIHLQWNSVPNASIYKIMRNTDQPNSRISMGETSGIAFNDEKIVTGTDYSYTIVTTIQEPGKPVRYVYGNDVIVKAPKCP